MNISRYIEIPFKDKGREYDGCDCYGLIRLFLNNELGLDFPILDEYESANGDNKEYLSENVSLLSGEKVDSPILGDVGVFIFNGAPSHVGVYVGSNRILHVLRGSNSVCESLNSVRLKGRLDGWYRPRKKD